MVVWPSNYVNVLPIQHSAYRVVQQSSDFGVGGVKSLTQLVGTAHDYD